ncbi:MAG TPA: DUF3617 family protein [Novosphingobium sp.]|nr:DUF3617 family protein [Novosphingobium sp.]
MQLSAAEVRACQHGRQSARFVLALIVAILALPLLLLLLAISVAFLILPLIALFVWTSQETAHYYMVANSVQVGEYNYPRIQQLIDEVKRDLAVTKKIDAFVYEQGAFNAMMVKFLYRRAIYLNSEILETGVSDEEVRWIVGRFIGYWRVQQDYGAAGFVVRVMNRFIGANLLTLPFQRATVYTGDRLGLAVISGDITAAVSAMQKLLVGRLLGYSVNPLGIVEQARAIKGNFFAFLTRIGSSFPHTISRYVDLIAFASTAYDREFARFKASNPGLAEDLRALSAEAPSGGIPRALGYAVAVFVALALPFWAVFAWTWYLGGGTNSVGEPSAYSGDLERPEPGEYRQTARLTIYEDPGGRPRQTVEQSEGETSTYCLSKADSDKGFAEMFKKVTGSDCKYDRFDASGGKLDGAMTCGGTARYELAGDFSPTGSHLTIKGDPGGGGYMEIDVTNQRIGDCG